MAYSRSDVSSLLTSRGATPAEATTLSGIAMAESGGNPNAGNTNDPYGGSFGLYQINGVHGLSMTTMTDPVASTDYALSLYRSQGTTPWQGDAYVKSLAGGNIMQPSDSGSGPTSGAGGGGSPAGLPALPVGYVYVWDPNAISPDGASYGNYVAKTDPSYNPGTTQTQTGGTYETQLPDGRIAVMQNTSNGPQVITTYTPTTSSNLGGPTPTGMQPEYDANGKIVAYIPDPNFLSVNTPSPYGGGQTPTGMQPVYDSNGKIAKYVADPSYVAPGAYSGPTPTGMQPEYGPNGSIIAYIPDPSYANPNTPSPYGGGQTPIGMQPVYDDKGHITKYIADPNYKPPVNYYGGTKNMGSGITGITDTTGGIVSTQNTPGYLSPAQIAAADKALATNTSDLKLSLASQQAIAAGQVGASLAATNASIANTKAQIASNDKIATMQDATTRANAIMADKTNRDTATLSAGVTMRGQNINYASTGRGQDITQQQNVTGEVGQYYGTAAALSNDPIRQTDILTGGAGTGTPDAIAADQYRQYMQPLIAAGPPPVQAQAPISSFPTPTLGGGGGTLPPAVVSGPATPFNAAWNQPGAGAYDIHARTGEKSTGPDEIVLGSGKKVSLTPGQKIHVKVGEAGDEGLLLHVDYSGQPVLDRIVPHNLYHGGKVGAATGATTSGIGPMAANTQPAGWSTTPVTSSSTGGSATPINYGQTPNEAAMGQTPVPTITQRTQAIVAAKAATAPPMQQPMQTTAGGRVWNPNTNNWVVTPPTPASTPSDPNALPSSNSPTSGGSPQYQPFAWNISHPDGSQVSITPAPTATPTPSVDTQPVASPTISSADQGVLTAAGLGTPTDQASLDAAKAKVTTLLGNITSGNVNVATNLNLPTVFGQTLGNPQQYAAQYNTWPDATKNLLTSAYGEAMGMDPASAKAWFEKTIAQYQPTSMSNAQPVSYG